MVIRNPTPMLIILPRTAPMTDAQPLIPHAQGTRDGKRPEVSRSPMGKGQPRKKDKLSTMTTVRTILPANGKSSAHTNILSSRRA